MHDLNVVRGFKTENAAWHACSPVHVILDPNQNFTRRLPREAKRLAGKLIRKLRHYVETEVYRDFNVTRKTPPKEGEITAANRRNRFDTVLSDYKKELKRLADSPPTTKEEWTDSYKKASEVIGTAFAAALDDHMMEMSAWEAFEKQKNERLYDLDKLVKKVTDDAYTVMKKKNGAHSFRSGGGWRRRWRRWWRRWRRPRQRGRRRRRQGQCIRGAWHQGPEPEDAKAETSSRRRWRKRRWQEESLGSHVASVRGPP
jgi:hypothetical protein